MSYKVDALTTKNRAKILAAIDKALDQLPLEPEMAPNKELLEYLGKARTIACLIDSQIYWDSHRLDTRGTPRGRTQVCHIETTYKKIVDAIGEPSGMYDSYKSDVGWCVETTLGEVHIYNYKNGKNYLGEKEGIATKKITEWSLSCWPKTNKNVFKLENYMLKILGAKKQGDA